MKKDRGSPASGQTTDTLPVANGLAAGATTPTMSFDGLPGQPFEVTADSDNVIGESNETDNTRSLATCG